MGGRIAAMVAAAVMVPSSPPPEPAEPLQGVLIADRDLHPGVPITQDDIRAVLMPPDQVPPQVVTHLADVLGTRPIDRILANEPIRVERVARHIPPRGMRGVVLSIDDAVLQWLKPGMHVDVMQRTTRGRGRVEGQMVSTGIEVLGVFDSPAESPDAPPTRATVVLAASRRDAERLVTAQQSGALRLALRSGMDRLGASADGESVTDGCILYAR